MLSKLYKFSFGFSIPEEQNPWPVRPYEIWLGPFWILSQHVTHCLSYFLFSPWICQVNFLHITWDLVLPLKAFQWFFKWLDYLTLHCLVLVGISSESPSLNSLSYSHFLLHHSMYFFRNTTIKMYLFYLFIVCHLLLEGSFSVLFIVVFCS